MNNKLFWKISGVFLFILIAVAAVFIYVTVFTSRMYFEEVNQKFKIEAEIVKTKQADYDHSGITEH